MQRLKIGHRKPRGGATNPLYDTELREIVVEREDEGKQPLHLITNDHSRPAAEIAALYRQRWQIELVFKWIKQNLKIKTFLGRSENAVRQNHPQGHLINANQTLSSNSKSQTKSTKHENPGHQCAFAGMTTRGAASPLKSKTPQGLL